MTHERKGCVDINETAPRDVASMEEWATNSGVQKSDGLFYINDDEAAQAQSNGGGLLSSSDLGVWTELDLPAETSVVTVPYEMILTGSKAREEFGHLEQAEDLFERLHTTSDLPHFYLFLKLLREYERGQASLWYPWLNSLPRYFSNGSSLTHLCSDLLPPLVGNLVALERVRFRQFYRALKQAEGLTPTTKIDKELAKWAFAIVYTRSLPLFQDEHGNCQDVQLVPVADMFNHGTEVEVELRTDNDGNCAVVTTLDVPSGSPLRVSYGDPTNPSHLFARYGFLDETSPATFCKIMLKPTPDLVDMGYDHSRMLFYKDTGDVSEEVWDVLLYHTILGHQSGGGDDKQAFYQAHMNGDYSTKQSIHETYFSETLYALQSHVDTFLGELEELTEKTNGRDLNTHPRLPLLMRHNTFVRDTFLKVRSRLLEY